MNGKKQVPPDGGDVGSGGGTDAPAERMRGSRRQPRGKGGCGVGKRRPARGRNDGPAGSKFHGRNCHRTRNS